MRGGGGFGGGGRGGGFGGGGRGGGWARRPGGRGGGARRSDMRLKHDIVLLGRLDDGLGYYRFVYNGGHTAYVGVMAQEVQTVMPEAVMHGADGYMRVSYDLLGLPFETYEQWVATGAHLPSVKPAVHDGCAALARGIRAGSRRRWVRRVWRWVRELRRGRG